MAREELQANRVRRWLSRSIHIWPCFCVLVNFANTQLLMKKNHGLLLVPPVSAAYSFVNYLGCAYHKATIYWFLDWGKPFVYVVLTVLILLGMILHYYLAILTT